MLVTFYGVRGSLPAPGPSTARYGGNTSCVHVRLADGRDFVFDAGSGLRQCGYALRGTGSQVVLMSTHSHWDHIQGFPFFDPIFEPERDIAILRSLPEGDRLFTGILEQMNGHNHPVPASALPSRVRYEDQIDRFLLATGQARVTRCPLNHTGGGSAFRLDFEGASIAYVTDNELSPPEPPTTSYEQWVEYCRDVDVLIHDAQYTEADMPKKHGWGHSLISQVRHLAHDAHVRSLVLFHHDPERTDAELDEVRIESEKFFRANKSRTQVIIAFEGLVLEIDAGAREGHRVKAVSAAHP